MLTIIRLNVEIIIINVIGDQHLNKIVLNVFLIHAKQYIRLDHVRIFIVLISKQ